MLEQETETEDWGWVKKLGVKDIVDQEATQGCTWGIVMLFEGLAMLIVRRWALMMIGLMVLTGTLWWWQQHRVKQCFFNRIVCPRCGYNPTRRKSDGKRREDVFKVRAQLRRLDTCPSCGRDPLTPGEEPGILRPG